LIPKPCLAASVRRRDHGQRDTEARAAARPILHRDGPASQFRAALKRLEFASSIDPDDEGISAFARWLPCDPRTAMRWVNDEVEVPPAVAKLLRVMMAEKLSLEEVAKPK
jgi:hypothetical protein